MRFVALLLALGGVARGAQWNYRITASDRDLTVEAQIAPGFSPELSVDDGAERFVRDVALQTAHGWQKVPPQGTSWLIPACARAGCTLRYRFQLARAATALRNETAQRLGEVIQAPPSTWLL